MLRTCLFFTALVLSANWVFSQRVIEVSYTQDSKGNLAFTCTNHAFCTYIVSVNFTTFQNAKADHVLPYEGEVKPGVTRLFTVMPEGAGDLQIKYTTSFQKGCQHPSLHPAFTYICRSAPARRPRHLKWAKRRALMGWTVEW